MHPPTTHISYAQLGDSLSPWSKASQVGLSLTSTGIGFASLGPMCSAWVKVLIGVCLYPLSAPQSSPT